MALRAVFILADGRLAYERLLRRLQAKMRSKYTVYCIFISRFGTIYGILFSLSDFAGNITEREDVFSQFEVGCKLVENLTHLLAKFSTSISPIVIYRSI